MSETRLKILIVDDNRQDRSALLRLLDHDPEAEYAAVEMPTIEEALECIPEQKPDCVLLDYHLPDGNGLEFLKELRATSHGTTIPVVMMTGTGSESVAVEAMKIGAQDYLVKGRVTPESVLRAIKGAIYRMRTQQLLDKQRLELEGLYREVSESSRRKDELLEDLRAAKEVAERANAAKDDFLAALSHELRTPLMPILSAVSSVDVQNSSREEMAEIFAIIQRNVALEARLIDDLLDLTRIARGKLSLQMQPVDVHEVMRHALEICAPDAARKGLKLRRMLGASEHWTQGDAARLQQVFWNVLSNAVKFTPQGGSVSIWTRNEREGAISIDVTDSGVGVEPGYLLSIFSAFDQGEPTVTRRFGGLGLGLAISKALVEAQGGTISASSPGKDQGTTIRILIPAHVTQFAAPAVMQPAITAADDGAKNPTVLVVEDNADTALIMGRSLGRRGFNVKLAHSVAEALEIFQGNSVDVVVSDIGLPDGTGTDLMRQMRQIRTVPAIAVSGYGMEHDTQRSREAGFDEHLTKPITIPALEEVLRRVLAAKEGASS